MTRQRMLLWLVIGMALCCVLSAVLILYFDAMIRDRLLVPMINAYHAARIRWRLVSEELLWFPLIGLAWIYVFRLCIRRVRLTPGRNRSRHSARIGEGEVPALARRVRRASGSRFMRGRVTRELALTAARLVMRREGCTFPEAHRAVLRGTWTTDPVAGAFLAARHPRRAKAAQDFAAQLETTLTVLETYQQGG